MGDRIKYHPGFVGGLGVLLWDYREMIDIVPEKWLSTEGIRMDVLSTLGLQPARQVLFGYGI